MKVFFLRYPKVISVFYKILLLYWKVKARFIRYAHKKDNLNAIPLSLIKEYNLNRINGPRKRICYAPYNNLHFKVNGDVTLCSFNKKMNIGNIKEDSLIEIWNSTNARRFRDQFSEGEISKCQSCINALNYKSFSSFPGSKYDYYSSDFSIMPTQISFEISNLCNYACIMCNEDLSSSIAKSKGIKPKKNIYSVDFLDDLSPFIPSLKIATFIGGEPLLIKLYYKIWERIIRDNKKCKIHIQTNGSFLPSNFIHLLPSKQFEIGVSMDALEKDLFETIRKNADFSQFVENLFILKKYQDQGYIIININFCLMNINYMELPKMLSFCNNNNYALKVIFLNSPLEFDIIHYTPSFILEIISFLSSNVNEDKNRNFITEKNMKMFKDVLVVLENYYKGSVSLYEQLNEYLTRDLEEMIIRLKDFVIFSKVFEGFDIEKKNDIVKYTLQFIENLRKDGTDEKVTLEFCGRLLYFFEFKPHDMDFDYVDFNE